MKTALIFLTLLSATTSSASASIQEKPQAQESHKNYQTDLRFEDNEVPGFIVIERKGQKRVVIDSSHIKTSVKK